MNGESTQRRNPEGPASALRVTAGKRARAGSPAEGLSAKVGGRGARLLLSGVDRRHADRGRGGGRAGVVPAR